MLVNHAALLEAAKRAAGWQQGVTPVPGFIRPLETGEAKFEWFVPGPAGWLRLQVDAESPDLSIGATGAAVLDMVKLVTGRELVNLTADEQTNQVVLVADGGYRDAQPIAAGWCPIEDADDYGITYGDRVWKWNLANQEWVALLEAGVWAAADTDVNPQMGFVEFTAVDTTLTVRSCDGVKIAQASACLLETCEEMSVVFPTSVVERWLELAKSKPEMAQVVIAHRTSTLVMHWANEDVLCLTPVGDQTEMGLADLLGSMAERDALGSLQISSATMRDLSAVCGHGGEAVTLKGDGDRLTLRTLHRVEAARDMAVELPADGVGDGEIAVDSDAFLGACRLMHGLLGLSLGKAGMNRALIVEATGLGGLHTLVCLVGLAV